MKMNKTFALSTLLLAGVMTLAVAATLGDNNPVKVQPVKKTGSVKPAAIIYQPTNISAKRMQKMQRAAESGLSADFSIQGGSSQIAVWSENFDNGDALSHWTLNNQVREDFGPVTIELASTAGKKVPFSTYDADDVTSLHFDGDYRVSQRNTAHATSGDILVPANAQFHAYVGYYEWEECALYIAVSEDDFVTETELWNSKNTGAEWKWREVTADLSAFAGKTIKVRITYGEGTKNNFGVGGYSGDFYVDGLSVTGVQTVDRVEAVTGEEIRLADMSAGNPTSWEWSFPGATPETSTEQNPVIYYTRPGDYDVTLTVKNADGMDVKARQAFIHVEGQHPVARIGYPASFRDMQSRLPMVAPLVPVQWTDLSEGFPTEWTWAFDWLGSDSQSGVVIPEMLHDQNPTYTHDALGEWNAVLVAANDSSTAYDYGSFHVGYGAGYSSEGMITNFQENEYATTYKLDGSIGFPGAFASYQTGFAEKFSKPSRPITILGAYAYVTAAPTQVDATDLESVTFCLRKSENGLPGELLDMDVWTNTELGYALTNNSGMVEIEFSASHAIDDEFFITIEGVPPHSESYELSFAMAPIRDNGNTAFFMDKDGNWRPMTGYLQGAPGGQSSMALFPIMAHSVMTTITTNDTGKMVAGADSLIVGKDAGTARQPFFSWLGYEKDVVSDASWCRVTSTPNDMTLDTLTIAFDALPAGMEQRVATLTLTDQVSTCQLRVIQKNEIISAIELLAPVVATDDDQRVYDLQGRQQPAGRLSKGIYIRQGKKVLIR